MGRQSFSRACRMKMWSSVAESETADIEELLWADFWNGDAVRRVAWTRSLSLGVRTPPDPNTRREDQARCPGVGRTVSGLVPQSARRPAAKYSFGAHISSGRVGPTFFCCCSPLLRPFRRATKCEEVRTTVLRHGHVCLNHGLGYRAQVRDLVVGDEPDRPGAIVNCEPDGPDRGPDIRCPAPDCSGRFAFPAAKCNSAMVIVAPRGSRSPDGASSE